MNELNSLRIPESTRPTIRKTLTADDVETMTALAVPVSPADSPIAIRRLCELVADLRSRVDKLERRKHG